jgi:hypothetical protein
MQMIDRKEAAAALSDIEDIAQRVRQSRIYEVSSWIMMLWGVLTFGGYLAQYRWPHYAGLTWIGIDLVGVAGSFAIAFLQQPLGLAQKARGWRVGVAVVMLVAFGVFWSINGHFNGRQMSAFWPTYYMLGYAIAGLWLGSAFLVIGLSITALTLIGYFLVGSWFDIWMAFVNGGGLLLAGAWMRRE